MKRMGTAAGVPIEPFEFTSHAETRHSTDRRRSVTASTARSGYRMRTGPGEELVPAAGPGSLMIMSTLSNQMDCHSCTAVDTAKAGCSKQQQQLIMPTEGTARGRGAD